MIGKRGSGFTIVELMVTISVLVILTTIVVVRLSASSAGGRDRERSFDTSAIAAGLEAYYQNGSQSGSIPKGYYPGRAEVDTAAATDPPFINFLEGVPEESFVAPVHAPEGYSTTDFNYYNQAGTNADGSYTDAQARTLLYWVPYLYQPLTRNNQNCSGYANCVKFNLYYLEESTDTVITIRSKNQ